jgi:hypothetical protein
VLATLVGMVSVVLDTDEMTLRDVEVTDSVT